MEEGDSIEKTFSTSQIAKIVGVHPNTVRMYEALELIPKPMRRANGYRVFGDVHLHQFVLARTAFQIEVLQGGLRKRIIEVVKLSAKGQYDEAIALTNAYLDAVRSEVVNAQEAVEITNALLKGSRQEDGTLLKRKEVSELLGITMDTLRYWEMNGLLKVRRKENGYRVYDGGDIQLLKIIRSLRCANYSHSSILRLMSVLDQDENADIKKILNTPDENEHIVSVCDKLIVSLNDAEENAKKILHMLFEMKSKYPNPPL